MSQRGVSCFDRRLCSSASPPPRDEGPAPITSASATSWAGLLRAGHFGFGRRKRLTATFRGDPAVASAGFPPDSSWPRGPVRAASGTSRAGLLRAGQSGGMLRPNHSFKPTLLRYAKHMAGTACHVLRSTTQRGLTQVLGRTKQRNSERVASYGVMLRQASLFFGQSTAAR